MGILLINLTLAYYVIPKSKDNPKSFINFLAPNFAWLAGAIIIYNLCILWPDFISMGERLRDYALLAEVIKYPGNPGEPWMDSSNLNYYLYWYRFAAFIQKISNVEIYEMYHILQSVTFSLYIAVIFRAVSLLTNCSILFSISISILTAFGSNIAGLSYFIDPAGQSWWGPSRVIKGTINEFPAWSFLLGDLHPHFLNLSLIILFFILSIQFLNHRKDIWNFSDTTKSILLILVGALWLYNANAWEVPVLGVFVGTLLLITFCHYSFKKLIQRFIKIKKDNFNFYLLCIFLIFLLVTLKISASSISSGSDPFRLVNINIPITGTKEFLNHWGFFLIFLIPSLLIQIPSKAGRITTIFAIVASLLSSVAIPLIIVLLICHSLSVFTDKNNELKTENIALDVIGFVSLLLLFIPEIIYLDDPYGGENERMNTVFKAYSANWGLLSIFTASISYKSYRLISEKINFDKELLKFIPPVIMISFSCLVFPFFISTIKERKSNDFSITPISQGLSLLEKQYQGSAEAIKQFYLLPDGITLEGQGNPYSLTSHVSTLAAKRCYLGWINHVDLLTRNYSESKRRADITEQVYKNNNCENAKSIIKKEKIKYIVVGPLEQQQYGGNLLNDWSCFKELLSSGVYKIYSN
jgi:uncharacterized membrane protein